MSRPSVEKCGDIGTRTQYSQVCSIVCQATALTNVISIQKYGWWNVMTVVMTVVMQVKKARSVRLPPCIDFLVCFTAERPAVEQLKCRQTVGQNPHKLFILVNLISYRY
jgi:hypothetical protein